MQSLTRPLSEQLLPLLGLPRGGAFAGQHEGQEVLAQCYALMDGTLFDVLQQ